MKWMKSGQQEDLYILLSFSICVVKHYSFFYYAFAENDYLLETVNELIYTPKSERDFGTLACWGRNSIGKQSEPCLFQIVPAGNYSFFFLFRLFIFFPY
jgi:hypothetical protein